MGLVWMVVVGLIAGLVSKALTPSGKGMGWLMMIGLGVVGSLVGGFLVNAVTHGDTSSTPDFQPTALVGSVIGAPALLAIWRLMRRRTTA